MVIVGGAIIGSAVATFLAARPDFDGRIVVVERDPSFRTSSTTLSAASIRLQFSTPLNIEISRFGVELIKHPDRYLAVDGEVPEVDFVENGYLFLATEPGLATLEHNHAIQRSLDVPVAAPRLRPSCHARFDWLNTDDLAGASLGLADEGWFDAYALLQGFRRKARSLGVEERIGEVVGLERDGATLTGVRLADGSVIGADWVGERGRSARGRGRRHGRRGAAGSATEATRLPPGGGSQPRRGAADDRPVRDLLPAGGAGLHRRLLTARRRARSRHARPGCRPRAGSTAFVWPALAHRVPAFDRVRLLDTWAGHYEVNTLDANAIIGPHPDIRNLLFANGFSGHGLQQAPAVGRGLAEWMTTGHYESLDLGPLGFDRIVRGDPIQELNVV